MHRPASRCHVAPCKAACMVHPCSSDVLPCNHARVRCLLQISICLCSPAWRTPPWSLCTPLHARHAPPTCGLHASASAADLVSSELWVSIGTWATSMADVWALTATCRAAHRARLDPALGAGWLVRRKGRRRALAHLYPDPNSSSEPPGDETQAGFAAHALRLGADPNALSVRWRYAALYKAACLGHVATVKALLAGGAEPRGTADPGFWPTSLYAAVFHTDVAAALLASWTDAREREAALKTAATLGQTAVIEALLSAGVGPTFSACPSCMQPLHCAVSSASSTAAAAVTALLRGGADPRAAGGSTLLQQAMAGDRVDVVEALLAGGVHLDGEAATEAPLVTAARCGIASVASALVRGGADLNVRGEGGRPLLLIAARALGKEARQVAVAEVLLRSGVDPNAACPDGETPLLAAVARGRIALAQALLAAGADPEAARHDGATPLLLAARTGNLAAVRALLAAGAKPDAALRACRRQPTLAAQHGRPSVEALLAQVAGGGAM